MLLASCFLEVSHVVPSVFIQDQKIVTFQSEVVRISASPRKTATCTKKLAPRNLRRALANSDVRICAELAQRKDTCAEILRRLRRVACAKQTKLSYWHRATCIGNWHRQLAQSKFRALARSNLHRTLLHREFCRHAQSNSQS